MDEAIKHSRFLLWGRALLPLVLLSIFTVTNVVGFLAGLFIMYFTGFLVLQ